MITEETFNDQEKVLYGEQPENNQITEIIIKTNLYNIQTDEQKENYKKYLKDTPLIESANIIQKIEEPDLSDKEQEYIQ